MIVAGSIYNTVKLAQLEGKWQQKKESSKKKKKEEEITPEMRELMRYQEEMKQIREGNQMSSIDTKLKSGADLTPDEIAYLKKNRPEAYQEYEEVKREREAYKSQLKNCRTKEEVEKVKLSKMGNFMAEAKNISQNPNIPKEKKLKLMEKLLKKTMGVHKIHSEFTKSQVFRNLPANEQEEEQREEESVRLKERDSSEREEEYGMDMEDMTGEEKEAEQENRTSEATFEETKKVMVDYIIANREIGGAFEYMETMETEHKKQGNV